MSFLDEVKNSVLGSISGVKGEHSALLENIIGMVTSNESGGLAGLVSAFKEKGLGDIVSSWVGTGRNLPISADQIQQGIGAEQIRQLAGKIGVSPEDAKSKLAEFLPDIVDKLTPEGKIPEGGLLEKAADIFRKGSAA